MSGTRPRTRPPLSARAPLARYSNYFEVGHNAYEFLVDFGQYQPESESVVLHTRIVISPTHAKLLTKMFGAAIAGHEAANGPIAEMSDELDPLEVVLRSLPDFERQAIDVRRGNRVAPPPSSRRTTTKR